MARLAVMRDRFFAGLYSRWEHRDWDEARALGKKG